MQKIKNCLQKFVDRNGNVVTSRCVLNSGVRRFFGGTEGRSFFEGTGEACNHLSAYIGKPVAANWEALNQAVEEWNDDNPDADWPINVKRFEIISNEELWD